MARFHAVVVAATFLVCATRARADDAADVRAAACRFFAELGHTTPQRILAQTDGYRDERDAVLAMDSVVRGQALFTQACVRRFGNTTDAAKGAAGYGIRAAAGINAAAVTIRGTHASIHDPVQKPSEGVRFEKIAGVWKYHSGKYPHTSDREVHLATVAAQAFVDTTAEVEAGEYLTFESAVMACTRRIIQPTIDLLKESDLLKDAPDNRSPASR